MCPRPGSFLHLQISGENNPKSWVGVLNIINTENTSAVSCWDGEASQPVPECSAVEQWGLGGSCRRVGLGGRMRLPSAQGHTWENWPVKWLSWFLDPSSAPRSLNLSFPKECLNLQTKPRIRISLISSHCSDPLSRQKGEFMKYIPAPLPWEKQLTLENSRSQILMFLNFTCNSSTPWSTKQGPDFLLLPRDFPRACTESDSCISSVHLSRTVVLCPPK